MFVSPSGTLFSRRGEIWPLSPKSLQPSFASTWKTFFHFQICANQLENCVDDCVWRHACTNFRPPFKFSLLAFLKLELSVNLLFPLKISPLSFCDTFYLERFCFCDTFYLERLYFCLLVLPPFYSDFCCLLGCWQCSLVLRTLFSRLDFVAKLRFTAFDRFASRFSNTGNSFFWFVTKNS